MKEGCKYKKLGDCCEVLNGFAFKSDKYVEVGTRVIRITNVQKGYIADDDPKYYPDDEISHLGQYCLYENDLLMSLTGNVGRVGLLQKEMLPAALNQRVACLRIKGKDISLRYLFYCLNSVVFEQKAIYSATGIAQKNMSTEWLKKYEIPVPSIPEQERIVAELDCLSGVIEKQKQQLKELDNLAQAIFYDMFGDPITNEKGWEVKKLREVGEIVAGSTPSTSDPSNWDGDINWITPAEMGTQLYYGETVRKITAKAARGLTMMPIGTVLLSSRAPIGKLAISTVEMCCNQGFKNVVCGKGLNNIYLYYYLLLTMDSIQAMGRGATFKEVSKKAISDYGVVLPPLSLQQEFASKIEAIEKQKELIKQSLSETETLFNCRMDYYFN